MSDESPRPVHTPVVDEWPMTPQEARDLARAQANLAQVQAQFQTISSAFGRRVGLADGTNVKFNLDLPVPSWTLLLS